jgi:hypothetical protein
MSEEDFLSRWSRRKQEATQPDRSVEPMASPPATEALTPATSSPAAPETTEATKPEEEFDLASLPSIDSITASTDITAFLRKGVPLELSRAALRRAWASDPAIRDFIGPAENAWDFNDPNAMPGFGPLDQTPEQVRELVARIVGKVRSAAEELVSGSDSESPPSLVAAESVQTATHSNESHRSAAVAAPVESATILPVSSASQSASEQLDHAAVQKDEPAPTLRRTHGGALPR